MRLWRRGVLVILPVLVAAGIWPGRAEANGVRFVDVGAHQRATCLSHDREPFCAVIRLFDHTTSHPHVNQTSAPRS